MIERAGAMSGDYRTRRCGWGWHGARVDAVDEFPALCLPLILFHTSASPSAASFPIYRSFSISSQSLRPFGVRAGGRTQAFAYMWEIQGRFPAYTLYFYTCWLNM